MANIKGFGFGSGGAVAGEGMMASVSREEAKREAEARLKEIKALTGQIKEGAARQWEGRAKATIEALLITAGLSGYFDQIAILGVDSFDLVVSDDADISLGELNTIARTFETAALNLERECRSSEPTEEWCGLCNEYHKSGEGGEWSGDRIVITVRGVGIDLQNPPV
jgi:hypothetical protein